MPSTAWQIWHTTQVRALDEIDGAHSSVTGGRVRRVLTAHLTQAYVVLLASHFQGFCRGLHTECAGILIRRVNLGTVMSDLFLRGLLLDRGLERGNATPGNLGGDYRRLGLDLWSALYLHDPAAHGWNADLGLLNEWRNAIAHQDFSGGRIVGAALTVSQVRGWRRTCRKLARAMDAVLYQHLLGLTGTAPW